MLTKTSIKKPFTVIVAIILVAIVGLIAVFKMPLDLFPDMDLPYMIVATMVPGSAPEEVEESVTNPLEESLMQVNNVKNVTSVSADNVSVVILELNNGADLTTVKQDIESGIKSVKSKFPSMAMEPMIMKIDANMMPIMTVAISKNNQSIEESSEELEKIAEKLKSVSGVASVSTTGSIENNVFMQVNPEKMLNMPGNILANHLSSYLNDNTKPMPSELKSFIESNAMLGLFFENVKNDPRAAGSIIDELLKSSGIDISGLLGEYKDKFNEAFESMLTPEIISQLLVANNFEMPAGTTMVNGTDFYITIGDKIEEWEDFKHMPAFSIDLKEFDFGTTTTGEGGDTPSGQSAYDMIVGLINTFLKPTLTDAEMNDLISKLGLSGEMADMIKPLLTEVLYTKSGDSYTRNESVYNYLVGLFAQPITVEISDIAYTYTVNNASTMHTIINGAEGMMLSIYMSPDASTTDVTKGVESMLADMQKSDADFNYIVLSNQGDLIEYMILSIVKNLLLGAVFAVLVLLLFLKDWKPTVTVGMSIIVSLVFAFAMMYLCGVTLNLVSMGGLALSVGMLVDNSIVVIENIYRKRNEGVSPIKAAYEGTKQVAGAILSSTVTTVIVFLPIIFVEGMTRDIFLDLSITIAFSLFASLIVAITFVPMISSRMLKGNKIKKESKIFVKLKEGYAKSLNFMLNRKWITIVVVTVLFVSSVISVFFMDTEFLPNTTMEQITITTGIDKSKIGDYKYDEIVNDVIEEMDTEFRKKEYIKDMGIELSAGMSVMGFSFGGGNITAYITLDDKAKIKTEKAKDELVAIVNDIADDYPEGAVVVGGMTSSGGIDINSMVNSYTDASQLGINIYGTDIDKMREVALALEKELKGISDTINVNNGLINETKEFKLVVDKNVASKYNLTTAQVFLAYYSATTPASANSNVNFKNELGSCDVYIYASDYSMTRWYRAQDANGVWHRMYFYPEDDTDKATKFKHTYIDANGEEKVEEVTLNKNNGQFTGESGVYTADPANLKVYYDNSKINEVDMVTFLIDVPKFGEMPSGDIGDMMPMGDGDGQRVVPMFMLLKDESFAVGQDNNILYRNINNELYKNVESAGPGYYADKDGYWRYNATGEDIESLKNKAPQDDVNPKVPESVKMVTGFNTISHVEGKRVIQMSVKDSSMKNNKLEKEIKSVIENFNKNNEIEGVDIEYVGQNQIISDTFNSLLLMLGLSVVFIYLVMVAQFQSLRSPLIIMFTIPLALTGSILTLLMCGLPISVFALVGIILLVGIVVNNGIVYVDYVNKLMASGMNKREALLKTAKDRIRPILMTALTTICAMFISVIDTSSGAEAIRPMAITVVGGLVYATLLTLYFVPIMYDIFNRKEKLEVIKFDDDKEEDIEAEMHLEKLNAVKEVLEESNTLAMMDESYIADNVPTTTPMEDYINSTMAGNETTTVSQSDEGVNSDNKGKEESEDIFEDGASVDADEATATDVTDEQETDKDKGND